MSLSPFVGLEQRVNAAVERRLANATVRLPGADAEVSALYDAGNPEGSPFEAVATVSRHTLSLCVVSLGDVAEGDEVIVATRQWAEGQRVRISTAVEPDASGWATFDIVPVA